MQVAGRFWLDDIALHGTVGMDLVGSSRFIGAGIVKLHGCPEADTLECMVVGIGTDMIEIARIEHSVARFGERFLRRVYTAGEIAYCQRKKIAAESYAARFAAKEAGAKALGTGISRGVSWPEFEVTRALGQRPELVLHGRAREIADRLGIHRLALSLSHSRTEAIAIVIAES